MIKYTILWLLCIPTVMLAQHGRGDKTENREQIEALHVEHITSELNLTKDESTVFWPIYNEYKQQKGALGDRQSFREKIANSSHTMTEEESAAMIEKVMEYEENKITLKKELYETLSKEFSSQRLLLLLKAEHTFKKKMWDKLKRRKT